MTHDAMQSLSDCRPGSGQLVVRDNPFNDPAIRTQLSVNIIEQHRKRLAQIPDDGFSVRVACSAISFCDLQSETGHVHSESYHALRASAMQECPLCICLIQTLHAHSRIGDTNQALVFLNPLIEEMSIRLRSIVDKDSGETRSLSVQINRWTVGSGRLTAFALPGTAAARAGFGVRVPYGQQEKWSAMRSWLDKQTGHQRINPPLPTRLIDVGDSGDAGIRLVETATILAGDHRYAALSYRWGDTNTLLTTSDSIGDRMVDISPETMPKTIRDAVTVTRRLGLRYLWVDCLCIIQRDPDDWKREAATMGDVYMNAHFTISTHAAEHADAGFLSESLQRERVYACGGHPDGGSFQGEMTAYNNIADSSEATDIAPFASDAFFVCKGFYARRYLERSELSSRGWALQERILSPRLIHFAARGSLYFESREGIEHVETGPDPDYRPYSRLRSALKQLDQIDTTTMSQDVVQHVYTDWYQIVTQFSACSLTKKEDKLVALQGIARKLQDLTGDILDGVWRNGPGLCLLWLSREEALERNKTMQIPSWSWASVDGKIQFPHGVNQAVLDSRNIIPEIELDIETSPTQRSVLVLDKVVFINTHLRFSKRRVGCPAWDNLLLFVGLVHSTRYWDVHADDGQHLGWASLDHETRPTVDGLTARITCIKIASSREDVFDVALGLGTGFLVLFIAYSPELGAWQRVGMGQICHRERFQSRESRMKLV